MMINGRAALSCTTLADPGGVYTCEPLTNFPVKRDLVVDLTPKIDQMRPFHPYLIEGGHPVQSREEAEAGKKLRTCVECWACVAVCPISLTAPAHALMMVKLARFELDPRDGADRREEAQRGGLDAYTAQCASCRACESVCPKGIDVFIDAIQVLT
jgi:succinate dehydrogenase/fumarate reductase iron-sulfur protein